MRSLNIALIVVALATAAFGAGPCKTGTDHRTLKQTSIQNTQKKVNLGADQWRFDPKETAAREIESLDSLQKAAAVKPALKQVKADERTSVMSFTAPDRTYEITMKKPEWLLPYAGIYKTMMWVVTDVKTTCK